MEVILSLSAWYNFIFDRLIFDAIFIPVSILIIFALVNRKEYKNTEMLRFILTALILTIISRYILFVYMQRGINTRYLFSGTFYVIILCVPGFLMMIQFLKILTKKITWINEKHLIIFLLLIIGIGSICKALGPPDVKHYIHDTAKIIKDSSPSILISNVGDSRRVAWHAKTQLISLSSLVNINNPIFFKNALKALKSCNKNIFVLVKFQDEEFKEFFNSKNIQFPTELKLLKEFKAKHKRFYSLYKVKSSEKLSNINLER